MQLAQFLIISDEAIKLALVKSFVEQGYGPEEALMEKFEAAIVQAKLAQNEIVGELFGLRAVSELQDRMNDDLLTGDRAAL